MPGQGLGWLFQERKTLTPSMFGRFAVSSRFCGTGRGPRGRGACTHFPRSSIPVPAGVKAVAILVHCIALHSGSGRSKSDACAVDSGWTLKMLAGLGFAAKKPENDAPGALPSTIARGHMTPSACKSQLLVMQSLSPRHSIIVPYRLPDVRPQLRCGHPSWHGQEQRFCCPPGTRNPKGTEPHKISHRPPAFYGQN